MFGVLIVGVIAALVLGRFDASRLSDVAWTRPIWPAPTFSWAAMVELVVPLAITVLVVQNGQGFAVLKAAGHEPPVNAITTAVGVCSIAAASVGSVCSCLTGPVNGILSSSAVRERHYAAAIVFGVLGVISGCLAPVLTRFMLIAPPSLIATLAGLALLRVLHGAFAAAFKGRYALGSLVSFLVTVADLPLFNIGAAFWGLVAGVIVSLLLERKDFADPS
jgi:benzoate membrane transport protein